MSGPFTDAVQKIIDQAVAEVQEQATHRQLEAMFAEHLLVRNERGLAIGTTFDKVEVPGIDHLGEFMPVREERGWRP